MIQKLQLKPSKLLQLMFEHDIWQEMIDRANDKEINLAVVKRLCTPEMRVKLYERIITENYEVPRPTLHTFLKISQESTEKCMSMKM